MSRFQLRRRLLALLEPKPAAPREPPPPPPPPAPDEEPPLEVEIPVPGSLLLDVREPGELASGVAEGALLLPMDLVPHHLTDLPTDRTITVYCAAGARSAGVAHWLREQGLDAVSLAGGLGAVRWANIAIVVPPGVAPGTRVTVPPDGALRGIPMEGEVISQDGERLRVRVVDEHGLQVLVTIPAG